jgi:hypothetical protein
MPLIRCSEQKRQTLEQFYSEFSSSENENVALSGKSMLKIIHHVNSLFKNTILYGVTSLASLNLLKDDSSIKDWFVTLSASGDDFYISYLMPINKQPWPKARVTGSTKSFDELMKFLIIAMHESQGWANSMELQKLYSSIKSA